MDSRELSTEDYIKEAEHFYSIYDEYIRKLIAINKEENLMFDNGTITDEIEADNEDKRRKLREEYDGYTNLYDTDFYCWLTYDNIDKIVSADAIKYFKRDLGLVGKKVQADLHDVYGILKGIAVTVDDAYFVIDDESEGHNQWVSCLIGIKPFDIWEHRSWRIVTNDKGYI